MSIGRTAALVIALSLITGACAVQTSSSSSEPSSSQIRFEADKAVRVDLTVPRTAKELGARHGLDAGAFDFDRGANRDYTLTLPGGAVFTTPGFGHHFRVSPGDAFASSSEFGINTTAVDVPAARTALLAAVPVLRLNESEVRRWVAHADSVPLSQTNVTDTRVFLAPDMGYLHIDVEVRRTVDYPDVVLNWGFSWQAPAAS